MATTTETTVPARTPRPRVQYAIRQVLITNVRTSEACAVPGLRLTLADIQACVDNREVAGIHRMYCEVCGETVADCPELADKLRRVPAEWSWEFHVDQTEG